MFALLLLAAGCAQLPTVTPEIQAAAANRNPDPAAEAARGDAMVAASRQIDPAAWARWPFGERVQEWQSALWERLL